MLAAMKRLAPLMAAALAACAGAHARAGVPIEYGPETMAGAGPRAEVEAAPGRTQTPTRAPRSGQDWADGPGTPLSAYALQPNQAQPYEPGRLPRSHRVAANQSLYDIATMYQVPLRALIDQNHLEPPYTLPPGTVLQLPPLNVHVVESDETFETVAQRYNVDARSLALLNRMQPPYRVQAGDRLILPARAGDVSAEQPLPTAAAAAPNRSSGAPPPGAHFAWPLRGQVVARFGTQANGARLDGIEIAGREGDAIAAAADGEVVYAGSDLPGYGTLVLVRHADNYVTAYGFARRALVSPGAHVRAGQAIAELGPRASGPARLLFQVRRGTQAIDPAPLLGGS
jgi:murein DD-endopeptidase MepM/ murein hydrolase activator NlpD